MQKAKESSSWKDIIFGSIISTIAFVLISLLLSAVILKADINQSLYLPLLMLTSTLSGAVGGFITSRRTKKNGLVNGLLVSLLPALLILLILSAAYKGFNIFELIICLCCIFGSCIGSVSAVNIKRKRKPIKKH